MENTKFIIFDMDGVIFDTEKLSKEIVLKISDGYGLYDFKDYYEEIIGSSRQKFIEILRRHNGDKYPIEDVYDEYTKELKETIEKYGPPIKPYVREFLAFLKENGYRIALASGSLHDVIVKELKKAELYDYFETITSGDMVTCGKPDPEIFLLAAKSIDADPKHTIVIEDSFVGLRAAYDAGMIPIMVPDLLIPNDEIRAICKEILPSLKAVEEYIKENYL